MAAFARQQHITFPLLGDPSSSTIRRFGLVNPVPEWAVGADKDNPLVQLQIRQYVSVGRAFPFMVGMAFPGTFILDARGRVKSRYFEDFYIERSTVSSLVVKAGGNAGTQTAGTAVATSHLDVKTYPSDPDLAPGNRFSLIVDIEPHKNIHVYAPGAKEYKPVRLIIDPDPRLRILSLSYPRSEIYDFKPLNERVPVYQKPFRLIQELVLEGTPQAQAVLKGKTGITLHGTLEYQACDERECFNPVSLPLTWTIALRPLITDRPVQPAKP
jgi:AhpC/TSA family